MSTERKVKLQKTLSMLLRPHGKNAFINAIPGNGKVLDVGCGNNSPYIFKALRPDIHYVGLDVGVYNQTDTCDRTDRCEIVIAEPDTFHLKIAEFSNEFDAVVCSHNLEHCNDYMAVMRGIVKALKPGGSCHFSFPCEASVNFPSRNGCLNFFDDKTHKNVIPFAPFIAALEESGMKILFAAARYRPVVPFLIGLICEPYCRISKKQAPTASTWALYGFETVIVAMKRAAADSAPRDRNAS